MDLKEIRQIIDLMKRSDLTELEVEQEGLKLRICRTPSGQFTASTQTTASPLPAPEQPPPASLPGSTPAARASDDDSIINITSPMVGTFYRSPSPESPAYADINQQVTETTVVCIIEAMKVMNEIHAEVKGTIVEILVENGEPVEYGQPLFKVKKS